MTEEGIKRLAKAWKTAQESFDRGDISEEEWKFIHAVHRLPDSRPEELWEFVVKLVELSPGPDVTDILSAGPLEDLITFHGEQMLPRVEALANESSLFRELLQGVWLCDSDGDFVRSYEKLGCSII